MIPPVDTDDPALERLRALLKTEHVKLGVAIRRMNSPGSPAYRFMENVPPAAAILLGSLAATRAIDMWAGAAVLAIGCWWWLMRHLPRMKDAVFERTAAHVLADPRAFDLWWAKGALSLYAKLPSGEERAATRRDNWRAWVLALPEEVAA